MAKLSSRSSRAPPSARLAEPPEPPTVDQNDPQTSPSSGGHGLRWVLCNEDRLSNYSESSLSITSPVISDDDGEPAPDVDESETESDEGWDDEPEGDPNKSQNLRFRLQVSGRRDLLPS